MAVGDVMMKLWQGALFPISALLSPELSGGGFFILLPNPESGQQSLGKQKKQFFDSRKEEISVNEKEVKKI